MICTGCMQRGIAPARLARTLQPSGSGGMQPIRAGGERSDLCYFFVPPHDIILCTFWTLFSVHARSTKFDGYHLTSHHIINIHMLYISSTVACSSHVAPKPKWLKLALSESKMFEEIKMFNLENLYWTNLASKYPVSPLLLAELFSCRLHRPWLYRFGMGHKNIFSFGNPTAVKNTRHGNIAMQNIILVVLQALLPWQLLPLSFLHSLPGPLLSCMRMTFATAGLFSLPVRCHAHLWLVSCHGCWCASCLQIFLVSLLWAGLQKPPCSFPLPS